MLKNQSLASSSLDCSIKIWQYQSGKCILTLNGQPGSVNCLELTDSGNLLSCSSDKTIKVWNLLNGACINTLKIHQDIVRSIRTLTEKLISCSNDTNIYISNLNKGKIIYKLKGHTDSVRGLILI